MSLKTLQATNFSCRATSQRSNQLCNLFSKFKQLLLNKICFKHLRSQKSYCLIQRQAKQTSIPKNFQRQVLAGKTSMAIKAVIWDLIMTTPVQKADNLICRRLTPHHSEVNAGDGDPAISQRKTEQKTSAEVEVGRGITRLTLLLVPLIRLGSNSKSREDLRSTRLPYNRAICSLSNRKPTRKPTKIFRQIQYQFKSSNNCI